MNGKFGKRETVFVHESPEELIAKAKIGGSLDLSLLRDDEKKEVLRWYRKHADDGGVLGYEEATDFLEEFVRHDMVRDAELVGYIKSGNVDEHRLGVYLGEAVEPGRYVQSFYKCWWAFGTERREEFIYKFTKQHPEHAEMVVPFVDLSRVYIEESKDGSVSRKSILEARFKRIGDAKRLIEAFLAFCDIDENLSSRMSFGMRFHSRLIEHYYDTNRSVLYPYLGELYDKGFIDDGKIESLLGAYPYSSGNVDYTQEEEKEMKVLEGKIKKLGNPSDLGKYGHPSEFFPRKDALRLEELRDQGKLRATEYLLTNFIAHQKKFNFDVQKFLGECIEWRVPIFAFVDQLGLSKREVGMLIARARVENGELPFSLANLEDLRTLLEFNAKHKNEEGVDLKKMVLDLLKEDFKTQGVNLFANRGIVLRIDRVLSLFGKEEGERLLAAITSDASELWLFNPRYVLEHNLMTFEELIDKTSSNEYEYVRHLGKLMYHARLLDVEHGVGMHLSNVVQRAKRIIDTSPALFFDEDTSHVINQIFNREERALFVANHLKPPVDSSFLGKLLVSQDWSPFRNVCHDLLVSEPILFAETFRYHEKGIYSVLSRKEVRELVLTNAAHMDFEHLAWSDQFKRELVSHAAYQKRFFECVVERGSAQVLVEFIGRMEFPEVENWEQTKKQIKENEDRIRTEQERLERVSPVSDGEMRAEIKKRIIDLIEKTKELKRKKSLGGDIVETRRLVGEFKRTATEVMRGVAEKEKFFIFKDGVLDVLGEMGREIARGEIREYIEIHPEVLMRSRFHPRPRLVFREVLGDEMFSELFRDHIKTLVFWNDRYGRGLFEMRDLPLDLQKDAATLNPFFKIHEKDSLQEDYYAHCLRWFSSYSFYPIFEKRFMQIAREQQNVFGQQTSLKSFTPNKEFHSLGNSLLLLESSPFARQYRDDMLALSPKEQEVIISLFSFLSFYHLDEHVVSHLEGKSFDSAQQEAHDVISRFLQKMFEIREDLGSVASIPIQVVRALSIYYNKSCSEHLAMSSAFRKAIVPILKGNYESWRAWGIDGEVQEEGKDAALMQLKKDKLVPESLNREQYESWIREDGMDFSEAFSYQITDVRSGIRDVISLAMVDQHIEKDELETDFLALENRYEQLIAPLKEMVARQKVLRDASKGRDLTNEERGDYEGLKQRIQEYKVGHEEEFSSIQAQQYLARLRSLTLEELELQNIVLGKKKISFTDVFKVLQGHFKEKQDFLSDIQRIRDVLQRAYQSIFGGEKVSRSRLMVSDGVDLETHVLIGEKPVASCQHYDGSDLNFGLLSYISDPGVKIIQVRDEQGVLVARAVLRMVEDNAGQPQLFMERVYSVNTHPKVKEAMVRFALRKAEILGVTCYTHEGVFADMFEMGSELTVLHNRGSRSPYVYTDAGGGKMPDGVFEVKAFQILVAKE